MKVIYYQTSQAVWLGAFLVLATLQERSFADVPAGANSRAATAAASRQSTGGHVAPSGSQQQIHRLSRRLSQTAGG
jgi:hypothetical protein